LKEAAMGKGTMCPFSWVFKTKYEIIPEKKGCLGIGGTPEQKIPYEVWEPTDCVREKCKLWDVAKSDCSLAK
jgi:hypothetical protein